MPQIVRNSIVPGLATSTAALFTGQQLQTLSGQNITVSPALPWTLRLSLWLSLWVTDKVLTYVVEIKDALVDMKIPPSWSSQHHVLDGPWLRTTVH